MSHNTEDLFEINTKLLFQSLKMVKNSLNFIDFEFQKAHHYDMLNFYSDSMPFFVGFE